MMVMAPNPLVRKTGKVPLPSQPRLHVSAIASFLSPVLVVFFPCKHIYMLLSFLSPSLCLGT